MKTTKELIGKKRTVKLVTGLNYYSKKQTIPVLGKLPSKKINENSNLSDWGIDLGLRNSNITKISVNEFELQNYSSILIDGTILLQGIDY